MKYVLLIAFATFAIYVLIKGYKKSKLEIKNNKPSKSDVETSCLSVAFPLILIFFGLFMNCEKSCEDSHNSIVDRTTFTQYSFYKEKQHNWSGYDFTIGYVLIGIGAGTIFFLIAKHGWKN